VWFTCYFLDEVGRVTTTGQVTAFHVPNHLNGYPDTLEGIVAGAGNKMWFTEEAANRIGRISTS
jgi:virginiamycin B lyase